MKQLIAVIAIAAFFLIMIPFAHLSLENQNTSYLRYREEYTHNLKNPLIQHYKKLSCETQEEEKPNPEDLWNCSP